MGELHERWPSDLNAWTKVPSHPSLKAQSARHSTWRCGPIVVISELATNAELPGRPGEGGPHWHISISSSGRRPKPTHVRKTLRAFGMTQAEEDNHYPGTHRAFWMVVDPALRGVCECKATEETIAEPGGYRWQNPKPESGEGCRGCEYQRMFGKPCQLHASNGVEP